MVTPRLYQKSSMTKKGQIKNGLFNGALVNKT